MASRYTRRSALRLGSLGFVSGVAGCLASNDEPASPTSTATGETTTSDETTAVSETRTSVSETLSMGETVTSANGVSVTISAPRVRKIIFSPDVGSLAHTYPAGVAESQFLGVSVSTEATEITTLQLTPVVDETQHESQTYRHTRNQESSGRRSFKVPVVQAQSGVIEWRPSSEEQYRWTLPNNVVKNIGSSPRFEVNQFAVPDTITRGNRFTASLTVTNSGGRDGRFLAVVLTEGSSSVPLVSKFTVSVPKGETVTRDVSGSEVEVERSSMTAILDWGIDTQKASFSITE